MTKYIEIESESGTTYILPLGSFFMQCCRIEGKEFFEVYTINNDFLSCFTPKHPYDLKKRILELTGQGE